MIKDTDIKEVSVMISEKKKTSEEWIVLWYKKGTWV